MTAEKIEAIKKVSETATSNQSSSAYNQTGMDPHEKSQFQSFVDSSKSIQPSFEPLNKNFQTQQIPHDGVQPTHQDPIFAQENSSAQKQNSSTDQDQKQKKRQQAEDNQTVGGVTSTKPKVPNSLIQEMQKLNNQVTQISKTSQLKPDDLRQQAKGIIAQIEQAKTQLSAAQGEIKPAYQTILRNRLTHIDDNLKIALSKAGVEYTPPPATVAGSNSPNPINRFIGYLSTSQYQLEHLDQTIQQLSLGDANKLTQAGMLTLQMKMNMVSQQMELFTSLLNKALESTKTIMNVQV